MYEKPQYLTKDGFKRLDKNPHKGNAPTYKLVPKKKTSVQLQPPKVPNNGIKISDKTAKIIAMAFKDMLKEKK
jgi:hypothetical protein